MYFPNNGAVELWKKNIMVIIIDVANSSEATQQLCTAAF